MGGNRAESSKSSDCVRRKTRGNRVDLVVHLGDAGALMYPGDAGNASAVRCVDSGSKYFVFVPCLSFAKAIIKHRYLVSLKCSSADLPLYCNIICALEYM